MKKKYKSVDVSVPYIRQISEDDVVYEPFTINGIHILNIVIGFPAVYVFIGYNGIYDETTMKRQVSVVRSQIGVNVPGAFCIFVSDDADYIYDSDGDRLIEIDETAFLNLYENMRHAQNPLFQKLEDLMAEQEPEGEINENIGEAYIDRLMDTISEIMDSDENMVVRYDEYGNRYKKHTVNVKIWKIPLPLRMKEEWCRIDDRNPVKQLLITVLGGWFGLHKFMEYNIAGGLFYLITGAGCGIFYILDVISLITGTAHKKEASYYEDERGRTRQVKETVYYEPVDNIFIKIAAVLVSVLIAFLAVNVFYKLFFNFLYSISAVAANGFITDMFPEGVPVE